MDEKVIANEKPVSPKRGTDVRLTNLTKEFTDKTGNVTYAVRNFTTVIPGGKLIGLLGPSGCGKSTTLYMIAGLHRPTRGEIHFDDEDVTNYPPEVRGIGLVFQNYALYPHMTVKKNIMFPLENMRPKLSEEVMLKRVKEIANLVQIGDLLHRKPNQLSGGQQQRVAIARALAKNPKVLLLDEPLSNLDARLRLQTREEIKRIQRETGVTAIFVTHDQEEAMSISDEIIVMNQGVLEQMGHPQSVYEEPDTLFVAKFLGNPQINILTAEVTNKKVVLPNGNILGKTDLEDRTVYVGIRPEFFDIDEKGPIKAKIEFIEHIGRDMMFVCLIDGIEERVKIIVPSIKGFNEGQEISLSTKRYFLFDNTTEGRRLQ